MDNSVGRFLRNSYQKIEDQTLIINWTPSLIGTSVTLPHCLHKQFVVIPIKLIHTSSTPFQLFLQTAVKAYQKITPVRKPSNVKHGDLQTCLYQL